MTRWLQIVLPRPQLKLPPSFLQMQKLHHTQFLFSLSQVAGSVKKIACIIFNL